MFKETIVDSIDGLVNLFNTYPNNVMYRGHSDSNYKLSSSLERLLDYNLASGKAALFESYSLKKFISKFNLYNQSNYTPKSNLAWLGAMQHYGVPTRLIDFTTSPYVALYFTLENYRFDTGHDFSVIAIDYTGIMDKSITALKLSRPDFQYDQNNINFMQDVIFDKYIFDNEFDLAWIAEPEELNVRLDRQEGTFLLSCNRNKGIIEILQSPIYSAVMMEKIIISGALCKEVFALLRKVNLTSKNIYGDLDGLARSIRMELQIYAL